MKLPAAILTLIVACLCFGCRSGEHASAGEQEAGSGAKYLTVTPDSAYTLVRIVNPQDTSRLLGKYIFMADDSVAPPSDHDGAVLLRPRDLNNLMVYSSVHASALKELGAMEAIKTVGDASYFTIPEIKQGLAEGRIADGGTQQEPVKERILKARPGLILVSYYNGMDLSALQRLGIPVIPLAESCEASPLGRAEWIKLLGLIAGNSAGADSIYNSVSAEYNELKKLASGADKRPRVLTETMYQGVWALPGGRSYAARMIADAGGDYLWADDAREGSIELPFESVLARGKDADVWLIRSYGLQHTTNWLKGLDERYMLFAPARNCKGLWGADTSVPGFYEETPFHPDRLLKDYIRILHPSLLPDYTPRYFRPIEK